ncbi:MAG: CADD family putative folate metabolism protein [Candidatus Krumholzibacteriia bacterium]
MSRVVEGPKADASEIFIKKLDDVIARYWLLKHPYYRAWSEGRLSRESLAEYSKQYYGHVRNFPVYLSAVHSRCEDIEVRRLLLENLMDEEHGEENHPELWRRFAEGLGVARDEIESAPLLPRTEESIDTLRSLTTSDNYLRGVAALYAFESQVPEVARSKREGLKDFYRIEDEKTVSYFSVHEEADIVHRRQEREILRGRARDDASRREVLEAAESSARAMWTFLDGVYEAYAETGTGC